MAIYREQDFADRRKAAIEAKKALLEKFKSRPDPHDPAVAERQAARKAAAEARAEREAERRKARQEKLAREAAERKAAAEARRLEAERRKAEEEAAAKARARDDLIARLLADQEAMRSMRVTRKAGQR